MRADRYNKQSKAEKGLTIALAVIGIAYIIVLVWVVMLKYGLTTDLRSVNLVPFTFIREMLAPTTSVSVMLKNILGNVFIFVPLGMLAPIFIKKLDRVWKVILAGLCVSLVFEALQYAIGCGACDVDDLILNTAGTAIGALIWFIISKAKTGTARKAITLVVLIAISLFAFYMVSIYQPSMLPAQIEVMGQDALGGLDPETYDVESRCIAVSDDSIECDAERTWVNENSDKTASPDGRYAINSDTKYYVEYISAEYTSAGNVSKTIVQYERLTKEGFVKIVQSVDTSVSMWLDENGVCEAVMAMSYKS